MNDAIRAHLPICVGLLEIILFECGRLFNNQWYCETLYKTIFILAYYRLFRIGELREHAVKVRNVHVGQNKDKILFILYSSKTHNKGSHLQEIRTSADTLGHSAMSKKNSHRKRNFCPFKLTQQFMHLRGGFVNENENFFICSDGSAVTLSQVRTTLKFPIKKINLNPEVYSFHSFRSSRSCDLLKIAL